MATLKQIRARIKTAKNIQQITKAMKLVAAARLRRATDRVFEARPYSEKLKSVMESIASGGELPEHPLMEKRPIKKVCVIVVAAERGLAGSYNTNILRKASDFIKSATHDISLITVGKKANSFFSRRGVPISRTISVPSSGARYEDALEIATHSRQLFESGEVDAVYVCYAKFYSAIRQTPQMVQLLPIEPPVSEEARPGSLTFSFEPDAKSLLGELLPRYFQTLVWQALLESTASEFGSRMTAMTAATDNAGKMIHNLTLKANRERQAAITKEILEVVGGAEALKG